MHTIAWSVRYFFIHYGVVVEALVVTGAGSDITGETGGVVVGISDGGVVVAIGAATTGTITGSVEVATTDGVEVAIGDVDDAKEVVDVASDIVEVALVDVDMVSGGVSTIGSVDVAVIVEVAVGITMDTIVFVCV